MAEDKKPNRVTFRAGWYEFITPDGESHTLHMDGNGMCYVPEEGVSVDDFYDALKLRQAWILSRVEW